MKIRRIMHLLVGLCIALFACSPDNKNEVEITLSADGIDDGEELSISLGCMHAEQPDLATATLDDKVAKFRFIAEGPRMYYIKVKETTGLLKVMADQGDHVRVSATAEKREDPDGRSHYVFSNVVVQGSPTHQEYEQRNLDPDRLDKIYPHYQNKYADVLDALNKAVSQEQRDSILATQRGKEMAKAEKDFFQTVQTVYNKCFLENRDSWWGPMLMLDNMNYLDQSQRDIYEQFSARAKQSFYGKIAHDLLYPESESE